MQKIHDARPLSPHVGIYRWLMSNTLSILHRITGVGLSAGLVLLAAWLWSVAYSPEWFATLNGFFASWFGRLALFGFTVAFYYHLANGLRHLYWDMGKGFSLPDMMTSGRLVIVFTITMTLFTWVIAYRNMGAL